MYALISTALFVIGIYWWIVVCACAGSWLIAYGIINRQNRFAMQIIDMLDRLTEPALRPIRRVIPLIGGIDISPLVLLAILYFLEKLISVDLPRLVSPIY